MNYLNDLSLRFGSWLSTVDPTPTPTPTFGVYTGDEDLISPTWVGFLATFLVALITVFLLVDMNRRVRRVRYREEVREKLEAEAAEAAEGKTDS